jgi:hypothetical protein
MVFDFSDFKIVESFDSYIEVKRDMDSNQVVGWDHFFDYIEQ